MDFRTSTVFSHTLISISIQNKTINTTSTFPLGTYNERDGIARGSEYLEGGQERGPHTPNQNIQNQHHEAQNPPSGAEFPGIAMACRSQGVGGCGCGGEAEEGEV